MVLSMTERITFDSVTARITIWKWIEGKSFKPFFIKTFSLKWLSPNELFTVMITMTNDMLALCSAGTAMIIAVLIYDCTEFRGDRTVVEKETKVLLFHCRLCYMEKNWRQKNSSQMFGKKSAWNFSLEEGSVCYILYSTQSFKIYSSIHSVVMCSFSSVIPVNYLLRFSLQSVFPLKLSTQGCYCGWMHPLSSSFDHFPTYILYFLFVCFLFAKWICTE